MLITSFKSRLRDSLKQWHSDAHSKAGASIDQIGDADPEFNDYFGSKLIRARQSAMMRMNLDPSDRATLDLGLMFAYVSSDTS